MLTGGCQCGAVRYRADAEPLRVYCCHCTECRAQSSSAFGISVIVPPDALKVTSGQPRRWDRVTTAGKIMACHFCPDCGSRLWHVKDPAGDDLSIKGGSLDQPVDLSGAWHIWTASALAGVSIPASAPNFPQDHD